MEHQCDIQNYRGFDEEGLPIITFEPGDNPDPISDLVNYNNINKPFFLRKLGMLWH